MSLCRTAILFYFILFFYTETVKSVKKLISLLQIAVNTKIHVQLLTSDRFVVYIISRKWSECTLQSWVGLLLTATDALTTGWSTFSWLVIVNQSLSTSPNKDYTHLYDWPYTTYLYKMTPRLKPLGQYYIVSGNIRTLLTWCSQFSEKNNTSTKQDRLHFHLIQVCQYCFCV